MPEQLPVPGSFADKVQMLDAALTRKTAPAAAHQVAQTWRNSGRRGPADFVFAPEPYYLSDGGYSRLAYSLETGKLFLTSNSRSEVKAAWKNCKELIADVEAEIASAVAAMEAEEIL